MKRLWSFLFVPEPRNNHRSAILKPGFLIALISFYLLNQALIKSLTIVKPGVLGYSSEITAQKVFASTNLERQKNGLPSLNYNSNLSLSAQKKAEDMFANNYWAHNSPNGKTPWEFFKEAEYQYIYAGENLAKDFYDTETMIKAWMNSPTHRDNIINNKYQEIGIGVVNGVLNGIKTTLVVQHFGTPINGVVVDKSFEESKVNESKVLSQVSKKSINPLFISKLIGVSMFILIIGTLFIDAFVTVKNGTKRLSGSSISHIGFLFIILLFMIFSRQGVIF